MSDVKVLARWVGWCDPCETERPLVLTESGQHGLRAWLRGVGHEDRTLTLTCLLCGEWQLIDHDEEDGYDDAPVISALASFRPVGGRQVVVRRAISSFSGYPAEPIPSPRADVDMDLPDSSLDLLAEGFDLIGMAS